MQLSTKVLRTGNITFITIDLSQADFLMGTTAASPIARYGRCFITAWISPASIATLYIAYRRVNRLFAEQLVPYLRDDAS